ncbi:hypothetical protein BFG52_16130 [Acinetobacter larvae]|uniref:Secretin/TonB short N-terminal domain-containing protein n=2 Tax=Acinetobacter larvae TaxID=1789224 RepID=A0A1B2M3V5_9GAMM|nr:hypothetical protein BFG52_16130 [Acinetobacter larvae]
MVGYAQSTQQHYQIAAGNLSQALIAFSLQSGLQLTVDHQKLQGLKTAGLQGDYSIAEAFEKLLQGTALKAQRRADGSYTLLQNNSTHAVVQLETIQLQAQKNQVASAELGADDATLPVITLSAEKQGHAGDGYLVNKITDVGIWGARALKDTPYSVSVISSDLIENSIAKDMNQIFKKNPTTQETAARSSVASDLYVPVIRGFNPRTLVNGVSHSMGYATSPMMQDIDRVEIINGATGFLYGGGQVGGAINYITKKPTLEKLMNLSVGSYGGSSYFGHLDLGGQFDQENIFGYRINVLYQNGENPSKVDIEQKGISLVLDWKLSDRFYTDIKYAHKDAFEQGGNTVFNSIVDRSVIKKNKSYSPSWVENQVKSDIIENHSKWKINDNLSLRTNLSYEKMKHRGDNTSIVLKDNGMVSIDAINYWKGSSITKNAWQETKSAGGSIYLDSEFATASIQHNLTVGYSLERSKYYRRADNWLELDFNQDIPLNELKDVPEPNWNNIGSYGQEPLKARNKLEFRNILMGDDIVFNSQWSALLGANYATINSTFYPSSYTYKKSELTPTMSIIYKPYENVTSYITYIENLEQGDQVPNDPNYNDPGKLLDPYKSKQYELGAKLSLLNDKLLLTSALFRIEKANWFEGQASNGKINYSQDGQQIHQGLELGITGKLSDRWVIVAGGTIMDLDVKKASDAQIEGNKPTEAAERMAKIYTEYQLPWLDGLAITAGAYYTGKKYADSANTDILPAYTLVDMGLRYRSNIGGYPTTFNLNVSNLTNKTYWGKKEYLGDPRTVAFSIKTQF